MIKKVKKATLYTIIALVVLIILFYVNGDKGSLPGADYTTYSTGDAGLKALYLLTDKTGYNAVRYQKTSRFLPDNSVMVAVNPELERFNDEAEWKYLKNWIARGNVFIFIGNSGDGQIYKVKEFANLPATLLPGNIGIQVKVGKGAYIFLDNADSYTNKELRKLNPGIVFINILDLFGVEDILFNEYYHGYGSASVSIWDVIGPVGIALFVQLLLALAVFLFIKSRRFGKPVVAYEVVKRQENENMHAMANIYAKARANAPALESVLDRFKQDLAKYLGFSYIPEEHELILTAANNNYLKKSGFEALLKECRKYIDENKNDTNKMLELVNRLDEIGKGIK